MSSPQDGRPTLWDGFYTSVINSIPIGTIALDAAFMIVDMNRTAERLLGVSGTASLGTPVRDFLNAVFEAGVAARLEAELKQAYDAQQTRTVEVQHRADAGSGILSVVVAPLVEQEDEQRGLVMMIEDITERCRAEDALRHAHDELELRVENRTVQLQREMSERRRAQDALHERRRMLHLIISSMPNVMLLLDEANSISAFYVPTHLQHIMQPFQLSIGQPISSLIPAEMLGDTLGVLNAVRESGDVHAIEHQLLIGDQPVYLRIKISSVHDSRVVLILIDDITELKMAEEALRRRDAILETLAYASEQLLLHDMDKVLPALLAHLGSASQVSRVYVFEHITSDCGELRVRCRYEWLSAEHAPGASPLLYREFAYEGTGFETWIAALKAGQPVQGLLEDFPGNMRAVREPEVPWTLAAVPVFSNGEWWGLLGFEESEHERGWLSVELEALRSAASAIGAAVSRQRIEQAENEQRAMAGALRDSVSTLNSTLDFDEVMDRILNNVERVVPHDAATLMLIEDGITRTVRTKSGDDRTAPLENSEFKVDAFDSLRGMAARAAPTVVPETAHHDAWKVLPGAEWIRSYAGAPISLEGEVIGFLNLYSRTAGFFTWEHAERLQAFADHAAIAIKNARLYEQAQALAAIEERQRLARELHDGVSQSLGSATLIADVLPRIWRQDPDRGEQALAQLRVLTQNALAEMRMLLMELRPDALVEASLDELIIRLCAAAASRTGIRIEPEIGGGISSLPVGVRLALYRVAQEGLNNVVKHALATEVTVRLQEQGGEVALLIADNGRGFDPQDVPSNHFGLCIMQERIAAIGGALHVDTQIGRGTTICATCPLAVEEL